MGCIPTYLKAKYKYDIHVLFMHSILLKYCKEGKTTDGFIAVIANAVANNNRVYAKRYITMYLKSDLISKKNNKGFRYLKSFHKLCNYTFNKDILLTSIKKYECDLIRRTVIHAKNISYKGIAARFGISDRTAKRIIKKLEQEKKLSKINRQVSVPLPPNGEIKRDKNSTHGKIDVSNSYDEFRQPTLKAGNQQNTGNVLKFDGESAAYFMKDYYSDILCDSGCIDYGNMIEILRTYDGAKCFNIGARIGSIRLC